jgi:dihydrofolate reductase
MDSNRLIGAANRLPWHLPGDMRRFRAVTMGKPIVMGRKTFESIGKPLPGRDNIILTRTPAFQAPGCRVSGSIDEALAACGPVDEAVIIGGANVYEQTLSRVTRMYLTTIHYVFEGDEHFPFFDDAEWTEIRHEEFAADDKNQYAYTFVDLERRSVNSDER